MNALTTTRPTTITGSKGHTAAIFDLDGVLVDTANYHLAAWQKLSLELGFTLPKSLEESLKGVGRRAALDLVLAAGGIKIDDARAVALTERKNHLYLDFLKDVNPASLLPGAAEALATLKARGIPVALASASRNAALVLERTGISGCFDAVVDGTVVTEAKPDPRVFQQAASSLRIQAETCVVFEDAAAGVRGARRAGCFVVGVGDQAVLGEADLVVPDLHAVPWTNLFKGLTNV